MLSKHRVLFSLGITISIILASLIAIFWARGFKPDLNRGRIERTGLLVANSTPTGASVYLDDRFTSATDTTITYLEPKTYKIKIEKEGYTTWEKEIEIKADLASEIKALLFPIAPDIKPLTTTGAFSPTLSPDGSKIVYGTIGQRAGLYLLPMSDRPFPFGQDLKLLAKSQTQTDYTKAKLLWSPDSKQVIAQFADDKGSPRFAGEAGNITANLLIDTEKTDQQPRDITASLAATIQNWQQELDSRAQTLAITVPQSIKDATAEAKANSSQQTANSQTKNKAVSSQQSAVSELNYYPTGLIFSPDEEKVLFLDKNDKYQIYDLKAKKSYTLTDFPDLLNITWYPDSNHLIITQNSLISIIEFDGTNKMTVYSGKFANGFVFPHPSGTRLIILTTLTQTEGTSANLYSINLK